MKQLRKFSAIFAIIGVLTLGVTACKSGPKDADLITQAKAILPEGLVIDVKKGEATLTGEFLDDIAKQKAEEALKAIPGIKNIVNQSTVKPVEISVDDLLKTKVAEVLKTYSGVVADIKDGVITLNGEFKREDLKKLMEAVNGLQPKKIENKLILK